VPLEQVDAIAGRQREGPIQKAHGNIVRQRPRQPGRQPRQRFTGDPWWAADPGRGLAVVRVQVDPVDGPCRPPSTTGEIVGVERRDHT
jgi:hypothetical protein